MLEIRADGWRDARLVAVISKWEEAAYTDDDSECYDDEDDGRESRLVMIILMIMMMPIGSSQIAEEKNHSALPCRCEIDGNLHLEWEGLVSTPE